MNGRARIYYPTRHHLDPREEHDEAVETKVLKDAAATLNEHGFWAKYDGAASEEPFGMRHSCRDILIDEELWPWLPSLIIGTCSPRPSSSNTLQPSERVKHLSDALRMLRKVMLVHGLSPPALAAFWRLKGGDGLVYLANKTAPEIGVLGLGGWTFHEDIYAGG